MEVKLELGFTDSGAGAPFFTLDDPVRGVLDNPNFVLRTDEGYVDVTEYLANVTLNRGKSRELDRFNAGQLSATLINNGREFDPTYEASPFFGQIVPKRSVRLTVNDEIQFVGTSDDWNISYDAAGNSVAQVVAYDALSILSNIGLYEFEPDEELSGTRITNVLDNIQWSADLREIDNGNETLEAQIVSDGTNALDYLTTVEQSEVGFFFINKIGKVRFIDRTNIYAESDVLLSDDSSGIPYTNISVNYGSELLYNEVQLTSSAGTALVSNDTSKALYGTRQLQRATFIATEEDLLRVADTLLQTYDEPEFRFNQLEFQLDLLSEAQLNSLIGLELGDIVQIRFTPSNLPPQLVRAARVISIGQAIQPNDSKLVLGFEALTGVPFILSSELFGIMDVGTLGY